MIVNNKNMSINLDLDMSEIRLIHYALRKADGDNPLIDVQLSNIEHIIGSFGNILKDNYVSEIEEENQEELILQTPKIDIL